MTNLFGWFPIRDLITITFFAVALALLITNQKTKKTNIWIIGIFLWTIGMFFDALRRLEGWDILRIMEHLFQLAGSLVIAYAAYKTYKKERGGGL